MGLCPEWTTPGRGGVGSMRTEGGGGGRGREKEEE